MFTFGAGMYGQLGHNSTSHEYLPRKVPDLMGSEVTQIACGRCHILVYLSSNRLYSFGLGGNGQLGIGVANLNKLTPSPVKLTNFSNVKNLTANNAYSNSSSNSNSNSNEHALYSISAGGDQSFIITQSRDRQAVDFRHILNTSQILTINVVKQFSDKTSHQVLYCIIF